MDGKAGLQVASPFSQHQLLSGPSYEPPMAAKRCVEPADSSWTRTIWQHQQQQKTPAAYETPRSNWNANFWDWDSVRFLAKPADSGNHREPSHSNINSQASSEMLRLGSHDGGSNVVNASSPSDQKRKLDEAVKSFLPSKDLSENDPGNLTLKLGGSSYSFADDTNPSRQNKRVRSGSPGSAYPMCQVDDCRTDLTGAKDYHRRHKVCETHSKASKALVGSHMQRFCQQCSRFHPLQEFDEGKRSCRRRLAGHNRRRRKTQPEDALPRGLLAASQENGGLGNLDIVSLVNILSRLQGNNNSMEKPSGQSFLDGDQVVQLLNKIKSSFPPSQKAAAPSQGFDLNIAQSIQSPRSEIPKANGNPAAGLTAELLALLSALTGPSPDALALLRNNLATNLNANLKPQHQTLLPPAPAPAPAPAAAQKPQKRGIQIQKTNFILESGANNRKINSSAQDNSLAPSLPLRLFNSSEEDNTPPNAFSRKYFSSDSSNPTERSPSSSPPVVQNLFPLHSGDESRENDCVSVCKEDNLTLETSPSNDRCSAYNLPKFESRVHHQNFMSRLLNQSSESRSAVPQPCYTSSSGSDQSPASSNSDSQDRTGRIIFKLFGQHPSNFPVALRAQIMEWLSHSPSDMESYIRPGCVILSIFVSMPSASWEQLRDELPQRLKLLVEDSRTDFWRSGRVLAQAEQRLASSIDGKVRFCSPWRSWDAPEICFVQPIAVVAGEETTITLRGHNLSTPGTKIHCAYRGKYTSTDVLPEDKTSMSCSESILTDHRVQKFTFSGGPPNVLGRCFIEVEHGFKGNCFPVIVADPTICRELQSLVPDIENAFSNDRKCSLKVDSQVTAREEVISFLNELGWLFEKSRGREVELNLIKEPTFLEFSSDRFKFLFIYAVERDMCALLNKLLDIFFEMNTGLEASAQESSKSLFESNLLHRAVKRNCKRMVDLLLNYAPSSSTIDLQTKSFIFPPNLTGPGGLTPLHLAASIQNSEDLVDALTSDPQDVGLQSWGTSLDSSGQTPLAYALVRNNHSYNRLVERKLADKKQGQVSITISNDEASLDEIATEANGSHTALSVLSLQKLPQSCAKCMISSNKRLGRISGSSRGALYRPYMHSILAIAAVCVCVCLYFHGPPRVGNGPFKWENVDYGAF